MTDRGMRLVLAAVLVVCASGCRGLIYTHTIQPLDTNFRETPVMQGDSGSSDVRYFRYQVSFEWNTNAIGDIAKQHGFSEVYYADIEETRVLNLWRQTFVHVYGR